MVAATVLGIFLGALLAYGLLVRLIFARRWLNIVGISVASTGVAAIFGGAVLLLSFLDPKFVSWSLQDRLNLAAWIGLFAATGHFALNYLFVVVARRLYSRK